MKSPVKLTVYWGDILYDTAHFHAGDRITVGREPEDTFFLNLDPTSRYKQIELFSVHSDSVDLRFDDKIDGLVRFRDKLLSLKSAEIDERAQKQQDGLNLIKLSPGEKAELVIGHVSFNLDWVRQESVVEKSSALDWSTLILGTLLIVLTFYFPTLLEMLPVPTPEVKEPERIVELVSKETLPRKRPVPLPAPQVAEKKPEIVKPAPPSKVVAPNRSSKAPQQAKAAMGKRKTADGGAQKGAIGKANLQARKTRDVAPGIYGSGIGNMVKNLTEIGTEAAQAPKIANARRGDPNAGGPVSQVGTGGFSTEGVGKGGGGKSIGIGRTVGQGEGGFEGTGRLGLSGNSPIEAGSGHARAPATVRGGGLDSDIIDSIVRRRQDRIRLCYERQLNFKPKLSGKVSVQFVIGAKGSIVATNITEDTMQNQNVRSCILGEVQTWTFPAPVGGTLVTVDYPFVFESSARRK